MRGTGDGRLCCGMRLASGQVGGRTVDDNVATQVDHFVQPAAGRTDPMNGVLPCGAPLTNP
jgi:hypothetical protein